MMRRTWAALLAAAGLVVAGVVVPAVAVAQDELGVVGTSLTVEPLKQQSQSKLSVRVRVAGNGAFALTDRSEFAIERADGAQFEFFELKRTSQPDLLTAVVYLPNDTLTGTWWLHVAAEATFAGSGETVLTREYDLRKFSIVKTTRLTVDAAPEPVAKGKTFTVSGRLTRLSSGKVDVPTDATYVAYPNKQVTIWFDPKGSAPAKVVATVTTSSTGTYTKTFVAASDGYWSVRSAGTTSFAAVASGRDYLDVR